ncbi:MAG: AcvB/VirJ family lysyl-phosphatidylglycerol hydrolase [Pseudomonadota bacterium]
MKRIFAALLALADIGAVQAAESLSDLPVHITEPADGGARAVVVLWSGDMGWSGTMQGIADALADRGFGVAGVSSLRYFWHEQAPQTMAEDTARIAAHFADVWNSDRIVVAGYSFGANTIPFAWPLMPEQIRESTTLMALLSPFKKTDFEISFLGMLGMVRGSHEVEPAIEALPFERVLCLSGDEEKDMACNLDGGYEVSSVPGGHNYDRNWLLIADIIDGAFRQRLSD